MGFLLNVLAFLVFLLLLGFFLFLNLLFLARLDNFGLLQGCIDRWFLVLDL